VFLSEVGTHNFFKSLESTSAIAIPQLSKEMLLRNWNSAIKIFSDVRCNFKSATQQLYFRNFRIFLAMESSRFMKKNWGGKNLVQLSL
jgi:hypothetical protein